MTLTFADYLAQLQQGSGSTLPPAAPDFTTAMGNLPNQPTDTQPTVELRRLYMELLQQQNLAAQYRAQAQEAQRLGNATLAAQLSTQAAQIEQQNLTRQQQADQFAKTFGLQQEAQTFNQKLSAGQLTGTYNGVPTLAQQQLNQAGQQFGQTLGFQQGQALGQVNGQQTLAAELGRGGLSLQQRQQAFNEEQFLAQQAANPNNLILSALSQGARTPGSVLPQQGAQVQTPAAMHTTANPPTLSSAPPTFAGASGVQNPMLQQQVPVAANVVNLLQRNKIPQYGAAQSNGFMTSLQDLRENPNLRLRPGAMDAVSLRNTTQNQEEAGYLDSTLRAQAQQPANFVGALNQGVPRRQNQMVRAY